MINNRTILSWDESAATQINCVRAQLSEALMSGSFLQHELGVCNPRMKRKMKSNPLTFLV